MKLYKYRDFSQPDDAQFRRLSEILQKNTFWCARPDTLNDPEEFSWQSDFSPSQDTALLLTRLLIDVQQKRLADVQALAEASVSTGRLEEIATPILKEIISQCREEIGIACFSSFADSPVLWRRYGGNGAGVCVEVDAPNRLLNTALFPVQYPQTKSLHIDQIIRAYIDPSEVKVVYDVALLSKPLCWKPEAEIRFVAKAQKVSIRIDESYISALTLGRCPERS